MAIPTERGARPGGSSVDPHDAAELSDISDRPLNLMERAGLAFAVVGSRWQFVGH